jgi:ABC-2 type transport system ATP-binding protein
MAPPVVEVAGLSKRYGDLQAVVDVSFEVHGGEIFGLLGPNGAGKTTSVECVQGLRHPDAGHVQVLGLDPRTQATQLRPLIGAQLQESSLPQRIRVGEALELFSSFQSGGPSWRTVMEEWGLASKAKASFGSLSGGQRQRLLVALALVNAPQVVFLDEMTTGLDPAARRATWALIERIRSSGTTVVLVTHFMDEAYRLCDRLAVINRGRVVATGTPSELVAAHADGVAVTFTAPSTDPGFLASLPGVSGVERQGDIVVVHGEPGVVPYVGKGLLDHGLAPPDMHVVRPSLEDVYLRLVDESDTE